MTITPWSSHPQDKGRKCWALGNVCHFKDKHTQFLSYTESQTSGIFKLRPYYQFTQTPSLLWACYLKNKDWTRRFKASSAVPWFKSLLWEPQTTQNNQLKGNWKLLKLWTPLNAATFEMLYPTTAIPQLTGGGCTHLHLPVMHYLPISLTTTLTRIERNRKTTP